MFRLLSEPLLQTSRLRIAAKSLLSHSFYDRWQTGLLSREELQGYTKEYYQFEREYPRFLSAVHSRCDDANIRQRLLQNLVDREAGVDNHSELWLRFAEELGVPRESVLTHFHSDETEQLLRVFRMHARNLDVKDGLAALYAYGCQQREIAARQREALERYYGVSSPRALAFFEAQEKNEETHTNEIELLSILCADETSRARVEAVVEETIEAIYDFLNGVERRYRPEQIH